MTRLKELRLKKGVLQSDVAAYIGVNNSTYAYYERGTHNPTPETLCKLADFFGVTVDELLGRSPQLFDDARMPKTELQELYDNLNTINKARVLGYIRALLESQNTINKNKSAIYYD